jgi:hypothetical protein
MDKIPAASKYQKQLVPLADEAMKVHGFIQQNGMAKYYGLNKRSEAR